MLQQLLPTKHGANWNLREADSVVTQMPARAVYKYFQRLLTPWCTAGDTSKKFPTADLHSTHSLRQGLTRIIFQKKGMLKGMPFLKRSSTWLNANQRRRRWLKVAQPVHHLPDRQVFARPGPVVLLPAVWLARRGFQS